MGVIAALLAASLAVAAAAGAPPSRPPTLDPPEVVAGSYTVLRVPGARIGARIDAFGLTLPTFPDPLGGVRALVPVPVATKAGRHRLVVRSRSGDVPVWLRVDRRPRRPVDRIPSLSITPTVVEELTTAKDVVGPALRRISAAPRWGPFLRRPVTGRVTAGFGVSRAYADTTGMTHRGTDFGAPTGWPVIAIAGGRVLIARKFDAYGNTVVLDHGQTFCSAYLHMSHLEVRAGDEVSEGQVIGEAGDTGLAVGSHLHLGTYLAGVPIDPLDLLTRGLP